MRVPSPVAERLKILVCQEKRKYQKNLKVSQKYSGQYFSKNEKFFNTSQKLLQTRN